VDGTGRVVGQSLSPGTMTAPWTRVTIYLKPGPALGPQGGEDKP